MNVQSGGKANSRGLSVGRSQDLASVCVTASVGALPCHVTAVRSSPSSSPPQWREKEYAPRSRFSWRCAPRGAATRGAPRRTPPGGPPRARLLFVSSCAVPLRRDATSLLSTVTRSSDGEATSSQRAAAHGVELYLTLGTWSLIYCVDSAVHTTLGSTVGGVAPSCFVPVARA